MRTLYLCAIVIFATGMKISTIHTSPSIPISDFIKSLDFEDFGLIELR